MSPWKDFKRKTILFHKKKFLMKIGTTITRTIITTRISIDKLLSNNNNNPPITKPSQTSQVQSSAVILYWKQKRLKCCLLHYCTTVGAGQLMANLCWLSTWLTGLHIKTQKLRKKKKQKLKRNEITRNDIANVRKPICLPDDLFQWNRLVGYMVMKYFFFFFLFL